MDSHGHDVSCDAEHRGFQVGRNLKIVGVLFIGVFVLSYLPVLKPLNESLIEYFSLIWWAVLLGFLLGGVVDYFVPEEFIYKYLGQRKKSTLFFSVVAGFLMSACSHGILALAIQLYKKGASIPAVITFLLASPWANLPVTILLFRFFGAKALWFIVAAMVIALITGYVFMFLEDRNLIEKSKKIEKIGKVEWVNVKNFDLHKAARGVAMGAMHLANMVLWWILIGFMIAAVIRAYVPHEIFMQFFGPSVWGLILTLGFATIIEVCSEGSAPIAFEIFRMVGKMGNPFVFLMAGVATDYTEIGLLWTNIGKRTAIWLPIITVPQVLVVGILFNLFL